MTEPVLPRYPIYIPSKGRFENALTAKCLAKNDVPFWLVVEEEERHEYVERFGEDHVLTLPFSNAGSVIPCRNWIMEHSISLGAERHWQLDDNIRMFRRWWKRRRIPCSAGIALAVCEDFTDRYSNIAISGLNYTMFGVGKAPPFRVNCHVYSISLILNSIPHRWRGVYNEDTDICLQALADGWCTVQLNAFLADKMPSMVMTGGNTSEIYHGDGRLKMARALERMWPGVVTTKRRFGRPQHVVADAWKKFDTPLKRKPGVEIPTEPNEYGMKLVAQNDIKSDALKGALLDYEG